jgi:hypothetical protein
MPKTIDMLDSRENLSSSFDKRGMSVRSQDLKLVTDYSLVLMKDNFMAKGCFIRLECIENISGSSKVVDYNPNIQWVAVLIAIEGVVVQEDIRIASCEFDLFRTHPPKYLHLPFIIRLDMPYPWLACLLK